MDVSLTLSLVEKFSSFFVIIIFFSGCCFLQGEETAPLMMFERKKAFSENFKAEEKKGRGDSEKQEERMEKIGASEDQEPLKEEAKTPASIMGSMKALCLEFTIRNLLTADPEKERAQLIEEYHKKKEEVLQAHPELEGELTLFDEAFKRWINFSNSPGINHSEKIGQYERLEELTSELSPITSSLRAFLYGVKLLEDEIRGKNLVLQNCKKEVEKELKNVADFDDCFLSLQEEIKNANHHFQESLSIVRRLTQVGDSMTDLAEQKERCKREAEKAGQPPDLATNFTTAGAAADVAIKWYLDYLEKIKNGDVNNRKEYLEALRLEVQSVYRECQALLAEQAMEEQDWKFDFMRNLRVKDAVDRIGKIGELFNDLENNSETEGDEFVLREQEVKNHLLIAKADAKNTILKDYFFIHVFEALNSAREAKQNNKEEEKVLYQEKARLLMEAGKTKENNEQLEQLKDHICSIDVLILKKQAKEATQNNEEEKAMVYQRAVEYTKGIRNADRKRDFYEKSNFEEALNRLVGKKLDKESCPQSALSALEGVAATKEDPEEQDFYKKITHLYIKIADLNIRTETGLRSRREDAIKFINKSYRIFRDRKECMHFSQCAEFLEYTKALEQQMIFLFLERVDFSQCTGFLEYAKVLEQKMTFLLDAAEAKLQGDYENWLYRNCSVP